MRKTAAALITLGLAALALAGCSGAPSFDGQACPTQPGSADLVSSVSVKGGFGTEPKVDISTPMSTKKTSVDELIHGSGATVIAANQPIVIDFALYDGKTGNKIGSTGFGSKAAQVSDILQWSSQSEAFGAALQCATAGSRLLIGLPAGAAADGSAVAVVDVRTVFLPHAEGSLAYNDALGLPTVVRAPDGRPGIIIPDAKKPTKLVTQTLIHGDGPKVKATDTIRVQYTSVDWDTRKVVNSSWDTQSTSLPLASAAGSGFDKGLIGQTVGSQVLLVVPPADASQSGTDGNGTQVYVIDVLGIDPPSAPGQ